MLLPILGFGGRFPSWVTEAASRPGLRRPLDTARAWPLVAREAEAGRGWTGPAEETDHPPRSPADRCQQQLGKNWLISGTASSPESRSTTYAAGRLSVSHPSRAPRVPGLHIANHYTGKAKTPCRTQLVSMAAEHGIPLVAIDPTYTSKWGAQPWRKPLTGSKRKPTRHDAAAMAIGRRALGHPIRRRTTPPRTHHSDGYGHRTVQAGVLTPRDVRTSAVPDHGHDPCRPDAERTRATRTPNAVRCVRLSTRPGNRTHARAVRGTAAPTGRRIRSRRWPWPGGRR